MSDENIPLEAVQERDVDLLILEEFHASEAFQLWFLRQADVQNPERLRFSGAWHSVTHPQFGESDLEAEFVDAGGSKVRFLIENKVDALFMPDQAQRYRKRGQEYVDRGACRSFSTILIGPSVYVGDHAQREHFDRVLLYEDLLAWFRGQTSLGRRATFKARILAQAVEEARRGYQPVYHDGATAFWRDYWAYSAEHAKELEMKEPGPKPAGSSFVVFKPSSLPDGVQIVHKLDHGNADLEIAGQGNRVAELKSRYDSDLEPDMLITRANKSAVVRIRVPKVLPTERFQDQQKAVLEGNNAAKRLLKWAQRHLRDGRE